jgi:hypothetical protein
VLQLVCSGLGATPEQAWASARAGELSDAPVPEDFELPANLIAIRDDAERGFQAS